MLKKAKKLPSPILDIIISLYNKYQYSIRMSGNYRKYRAYYKNGMKISRDDAYKEQSIRLNDFIRFSRCNSKYYAEIIPYRDNYTVSDLKNLPFLTKTTLIEKLDKISTCREKEGYVSYTGGTTGASMKVIYTKDCLNDRFACLDNFRSRFGYELGHRVAWFSGKDLLSDRDIKNRRFYKDDFINKIRFFSTFHINKNSVKYYLDSLYSHGTEYIVGFPSSVYEICCLANSMNIKYSGSVKCFFPTAEVVTEEHRKVISEFFHCKIKDQYASSEGAPFILECEKGSKHIDIKTGVFEVLDSNGNDALEGELIVTSFSTRGTPLIRYQVGDRVKLSDKSCSCGWDTPIVESIEGRNDDYLYSTSGGKVNLGNISNSTKPVKGIIKFQIVQYELSSINVKLVTSDIYNHKEEGLFVNELAVRFGRDMKINIDHVEEIENEKSGKFRIVKNFVNI
ncbi:hypothetical protein [Vibrio diabolicus]|uniref:hypothetical protein n=1 Tax=Vibrio diabolicus TaxID=50719 RepID=UPI0021607CFF|nr:hypothetical protein [Vibrio diabolicus]MCS0378412.1 hypothetical protein [Vibrio diabolicus]MCS0422185.1 hypothetical protein [Vibrio diabolicus]